jgi:hypothetical protein
MWILYKVDNKYEIEGGIEWDECIIETVSV